MTSQDLLDYLIIGAGPAGLQLGYCLEKANHHYLILEAGSTSGTFFKKYPRHRTLISINKVHTGYDDPELQLRWDWNSLLSDDDTMTLKHYNQAYFPDADDLVHYLNDFAEQNHIKIQYNTKVERITKDGVFIVHDTTGKVYQSRRLIVATGVTKAHIPPIPGIELTENYTDVSVDPADFIGQRVLIIGKGNSAFETAENLIATTASIHICSPHSIRFAWQTHFVGDLRAFNNNFLDTYQLKSQNVVLDATIASIEQEQDGSFKVAVHYQHAEGEKETLYYDRIITCTGFRFDNSLFDESCRPNLVIDNRFPSQTCEWESTNIPDLYFAGTITQMRDYKKATSAFIHGFRYNSRVLYHILMQKYHNQPWPSHAINLTPEDITNVALKRINRSSALWQQFGFIGDLVVICDQNQTASYYEELPIDFIHESEFGKNAHYYIITLEYGEHHVFDNPFHVERVARDNVKDAHLSHFLHPIIRRFEHGKLVAEHHVIEDLAAEWVEDEHTQPLLKFFKEQLLASISKPLPVMP